MCYDMLVRAGERYGEMKDAGEAGSAAAASGERQHGIQDSANQRVAALIKQTAGSNPNTARDSATNDYVAALRGSNSLDDTSSFAKVPGASKRFTADADAARSMAGNQNLISANLAARIDAPLFQRRGEAINVNRAGTDLNALDQRSRTEAYLNRLRTSGIMGGQGG